MFFKFVFFFFFQAEDGIRDRSPSRGLGDVYKRQVVSGWISSPSTDETSSGTSGAADRSGAACALPRTAPVFGSRRRLSVTLGPVGSNSCEVTGSESPR